MKREEELKEEYLGNNLLFKKPKKKDKSILNNDLGVYWGF